MNRLAIGLLIAAILPTGTVRAQYYQRVPAEICVLSSDTGTCFNPAKSTVLRVGKDVMTLGDAYRFCMRADTITVGGQPVRVILAIDHSGSMCGSHTSPTNPNVQEPASDPTNQRLAAAHTFVDSLAAASPNSQIGILLFDAGSASTTNWIESLDPLILSSRANLQTIHDFISNGRCPNTTDPYRFLGKLTKMMDTYQGISLDSALNLINKNHSAGDTTKQHIIMLTDDGWYVGNDLKPADVLRNYRQNWPGRPLPTVHAVFLSSSGQTSDPNLKTITDSTGGMFIPDATPATVVARFKSILQTITTPRREAITAVSVTNAATGAQHILTITKLTTTTNDYLGAASNWTLDYGDNTFIVRKIYQNIDGTLSTVSDTLHIRRASTDSPDSIGLGFRVSCVPETIGLSLNAAPPVVTVDNKVTVSAMVQPEFVLRFATGDATVRLFTTADPKDAGTLALFHLEGNLLDAAGLATATGSPAYDNNGAFKTGISGGSFSVGIPPQGADFSIDLWIRRDALSSAGTILSGQNFSLTLDADGRLSCTLGGVTVRSTGAVFANVWTHVAVARTNGSIAIYINGQQASPAISASTGFGGTVTVSPPANGKIDEVRFSSVSRTSSGTFQIPTATDITWVIGANTSTGSSASLPVKVWIGGTAQFTFSRSSPASVIVNLTNNSADNPWSINSNPVQINPAGGILTLPVEAVLYDTNGNGYIDRIDLVAADTVVLRQPLPPVSDLVDLLGLTTYTDPVTLRPAALSLPSPNVLRITIAENSGGVFETGWKSATVRFKSVGMNANGDPLLVTKITDKAGPVIARVLYFGGGTSTHRIDTLRVTFSEPLTWKVPGSTAPLDVYTYYDSGTVSTLAFAGLDASHMTVTSAGLGATIVVDNGFIITPLIDSLQLKNVPQYVTDTAGNAAHPNSRRAPIEWGGNNTIEVVVGPNPFIPGKDIPQQVQTYYHNILQPIIDKTGQPPRGTIIAISTTKPLKPLSDGTYGTAIVFDAVGNTVSKNLPVGVGSDYKSYGVYWDGRNGNGRYVGNGTYLVIMSVTDIDNQKFTKRVKVGVRRTE